MVQYSTSMKKIGEVRLKTVAKRRALTTTIERASTFTVCRYVANVNAADIPLGWVLYDCVFVGGFAEIASDDDGALTIEKWDDQAGSNQTAISDVQTIDGGVALEAEFAALATGAEEVAAGYKLNLLSATFDGNKTAVITLFFKTVDSVDD